LLLILPFLLGFQLNREPSGRLTLVEKNCEQVRSTIQDFSDWKKTSDGQTRCDPNTLPLGQDGGRCWADATNCLPEHVQKYQGLTANEGGPNCFNMSLVMSKILPNHRYSSEEEFAYYMRPPLCRSLKAGEARKPGDVGAIRNQEGVEHAFIYINERVAYTKNSGADLYPYTLQPVQAMRQIFAGGTTFFRCQTMKEYLKNNPNTSAELKNIYRGANQFDRCLEHSAFTGEALTNEALKNLRQTGEALAFYLEEQRKKMPQPKENSEEEFLLGALQVRLVSFAEQLKIFSGYQNDEAELRRLAERLRR